MILPRMNVMVVLAFALATGGCDKKEEKASSTTTTTSPTTTTPAPSAAPAPAPAPAPAAGKTAQLTCAKVAPSAATWFKDAKLEEKDSCPTMPGKCGPSCSWVNDGGESLNLGFQCNMPNREADKKTAYDYSIKRQKEAKDLPGVGAMAFQFAPMKGMTMVQAWDDDTQCVVTISAIGPFEPKAVDLAKEALASVKPGDVD